MYTCMLESPSSHDIYFFDALYRWHGSYAFAFSLCTWHGSLRFLGVSDYSRVICRYYSYYIDPYIYGLNWWTDRYAANQNYQRFPQERMRNELFHHNAIEALRTYGYDGIWCWNFDQQWRRWQTKIGIQVLPTGKIDHEVLDLRDHIFGTSTC